MAVLLSGRKQNASTTKNRIAYFILANLRFNHKNPAEIISGVIIVNVEPAFPRWAMLFDAMTVPCFSIANFGVSIHQKAFRLSQVFLSSPFQVLERPGRLSCEMETLVGCWVLLLFSC
jgi:hypothetical protein